MQLSETAKSILEKRYLQPGETPEDMCWRVAKTVASVEKDRDTDWGKTFAQIMLNLDFLPNTPTLMNAGTNSGQLSACFVLPIEDSMHGIFKTLYDAAMIQKTGGGVGFNFSRLRPKGTPVSSTRGVSSGPISFLRVYNAASSEVEQGGARRGANMACMSVYHPDIEEFITCKDEEGVLENFNISVLIDDAFLRTVENDGVVLLSHSTQSYAREVKARELFDKIAYQAWKNGEPGVIFIDRVNEDNPTKHLGDIESTNPCGEQPLLPYESCNLGSINLANMLTHPKQGEFWVVDFDRIREVTRIAIRFLDNVIDVNEYPLDEVKAATKRTRKIGLGVMGWGTLLTRLGIPYGSPESFDLGRKIQHTIKTTALATSRDLADEKGTFPEFKPSYEGEPERRNATLTTIAPTGSLATIAGVSYGIEPIFALTYQKKMVDDTYTEVNQDFLEHLNNWYFDGSIDEVKRQVIETGSCQDVISLSARERRIWRTASEIPRASHIDMQAVFQEHTDNAVSKTINMPADSTPLDFKLAISYAHRQGCKGLTMYRVASRQKEAVSIGTSQTYEVAPTISVDEFELVVPEEKEGYVKPRKRPRRAHGFTERMSTGCGKLYVTINSDDQGPLETFVETGSGGGCEAYSEGLSRVISLCLRAGVDPKVVVEQLKKVSCKNFVRQAVNGDLEGKSCPDVVGRVLTTSLQMYEPGSMYEPEEIPEHKIWDMGTIMVCPNCNNMLDAAEGCWTCANCGYNRC